MSDWQVCYSQRPSVPAPTTRPRPRRPEDAKVRPVNPFPASWTISSSPFLPPPVLVLVPVPDPKPQP